MKDFVESIVKRLIDHPDQLVIEEEDRDNSIIVRVTVNDADVGKLIGKKGRTAQSLRVILSAVAARHGKRAILEITE
jgi:predicted RNA-binding protein YlqC (UPF0109 family)